MTTALIAQRENIDLYMSEVNKYSVLSRTEEQALAQRFVDGGDLEAARLLVVHNLRFVVKVAHEYKGYGLKILDLIQEGNIGLMVAVKKFDPYKGYRLISYAVWWIRAHIQSFILRSWSLVRLGAGRVKRKLFFKLRSARSKAEQGKHSDTTPEELAEILGVTPAEVADMDSRLAARDFSLDAELGDNSIMTHLDTMPAAGPSAEEALGDCEQQERLRAKVRKAMGTLNEKERRIVESRLLADEPQTLQQIGSSFNVSRERVRQLEARVIAKLRAAMSTGDERLQDALTTVSI